MPDCEFNASQQLARKAFNNALDKASNANAAIIDEIGQSIGGLLAELASEAGGILEDAATGAIDNLVAEALSNVSSLGIGHGLSSVGTMIAMLLSGGDVAYLGLAAFLTSLLQAELEQRIYITLILQEDMELVRQLLAYIKSIFSSGDTDLMLKSLQDAYKHIVNSTSYVGDISNKLETRNSYDLNKAISANRELALARDKMKTPLLDSILTVISTSGFASTGFIGGFRNEVQHLTNPAATWERLTNSDNTEIERIEAERAASRATQDQHMAELLSGLSQFTGVPFGALLVTGELAKILKKIKDDLTKFLPLSVLGVLGPAGSVAGYLLTGNDLSIQGLLELSRKRTLLSLNDTIETKLTKLSKYSKSWESLNTLTSVLLPLVNRTLKMLESLKKDVGQYAGKNATKNIGSGAVLAMRMGVWKQQMDTIQKNIDSMTELGAQSQGVGEANKRLDILLGVFEDKVIVYNEGVPESELAYDLIFKVMGEILDAILGNSSISKMESQVAESLASLKISVDTDKRLLGQIKSFQGSVLSIPGIEDMIKMTAGLLDTKKYKNSPLASVVGGIRNGDLAALTNISMAAVTGAIDISNTVSNIAAGNEVESTGNPVADAVLQSMGAMYSDIGDCINKILENNEPAKLVQIEALKASSEKATLYAESRKHAEAENFYIGLVIKEQTLAIKGESKYPPGTSPEDFAALDKIRDSIIPDGYHMFIQPEEDGQ